MLPPKPFPETGSRTPAAFLRWVGPKARLGLMLSCLLTSSVLRAGETTATRQDQPPVKFCMSSRLFRQVNENDARASVKAYAKQVAESRGLIADSNPKVFTGAAELTSLLKRGEVDLVSMPTEEYLAQEESLVTGPILISLINGSDYEEYVLLVHADSSFHALSDLKGGRVLVLDNLQGALAGPWLEVLLANETLSRPEKFFSVITRPFKASQVVLPVFFHRSEACVVTRQGFALMGELNPQVTKQLRVLATSPQLVPHMTCFRAGFDPLLREKMVSAVTGANTSSAGKQLMTIFQCDGVAVRPLSKLQNTR